MTKPVYGSVVDVVNIKTKREALAAMRTKEGQMSVEIDKIMKATQSAVEDDEPVQGCGAKFFCLGRRRASTARATTSLDARVFGKATKQTDATQRLNHAAESVEAHVEQLAEKVRAAETRARELFAQQKKPEAIAALKRAKALQKQLETASATHAALERQVDVLAESALQREVASALSASVASTKKKTKGLLSKTENAVDSAVELKDFAEDVAQTLGGLQTDVYDDDDLLAELEDMQETPTEPVSQHAIVVPTAIAVQEADFPTVPAKKPEERRKLLDDDAQVALAQ
jgi:hypothetical protein